MKEVEKIIKIVKEYKKYTVVFFIFAVAFLFGENLEKDKELRPDIYCKSEEQIIIPAKPEINGNTFYQINNIINSGAGDYYRLFFKAKSSQEEKIKIKTVSFLGNQIEIHSMDLEKSDDLTPYEVLFKTDDYFNSLRFAREGTEIEDIEIFIKDIQISRLKVEDDSELAFLKSTVNGNTQMVVSEANQDSKEGEYFSDLRNKGVSVGQVFKAESEFLAAVSFQLRQAGNGGPGKYQVELKRAKEENGKMKISNNVMAYLDFTAEDLEKVYAQEDGSVRFPLTSFLKKGEYYYAGINNYFAKTNFLNYLEIKGTKNKEIYKNGNAVARKNKKAEELGDLFFTVWSAEFNTINSERILTGSRIEDLGSGVGRYIYHTNNAPSDLLDLYSYTAENYPSPKIRFNNHENIISGSPEGNHCFIYKINTIYPFKELHLKAEQMYTGWYKVKIYYSYDKQAWREVDYSRGEEYPQIFDSVITGDGVKKKVYFKVGYDGMDDKEIRLFGLRSFKVTAELDMK